MRTDHSFDNLRGVSTAFDLADVVAATDDTPGLAIDGLSPGAEVSVQTANSRYRLFVLDPDRGTVVVKGGRHFPGFTTAVLVGATYTGGALKQRWIGLGMCLELHCDDGPVLTSPVRGVAVVRGASSAKRGTSASTPIH